ncbi:MAG: AMP-binding protein [Streptosporangiales bacterium]|nr:AMP-binding protein [Streptosporangiales bacterium]
MSPFSESFWSEREIWSRDRLADFQLRALRTQLDRVARTSGFYRDRLAEVGLEPGDLTDLEDLAALPVTTKADYVAALERRPPWGDALSVELDDVVRVHYSSGTTGAPTPVCWTADDLDRWADLYARCAYAQGVRAGDVYQCLFSFAWFVGGLGAVAGYQRIGATCIPGGSADTERQIDTILRYRVTAVGGTPSFLTHLAETARNTGRPLDAGRVRRAMVGGEPGGCVPAARALIERLWNAKCYDGYGSLEFQPIAWECTEQAGGHLAEDFCLAEVVDPETRRPVPDGTPGVLVLTHLDKQASPLIRWWTGDVVVRDSGRCRCGRTHARLPGGVRGRADDMLVVRGVNLFPSAVENIVRRQPHTTGEYLIVLDDDVRDPVSGFLTGVKLRVETLPDAPADFADALHRSIRAELTVRADVERVPAGSLPRSTHKAHRVVRE